MANRPCELRDLGLMRYAEAFAIQKDLEARRKAGTIPDQLLIVEHPHAITLGRNGHPDHLLASADVLERTGISFHYTDRGGDITYHGPGQIVGYPIIDLREWKRDVGAYVRAVEQAIIDTLADFGIAGEREAGATGVWVNGKKAAAIGVHISRWVTTHGFALNHITDLSYFQYIVPCGLTKPVTSLRDLGVNASREQVTDSLVRHLAGQFELDISNVLQLTETI